MGEARGLPVGGAFGQLWQTRHVTVFPLCQRSSSKRGHLPREPDHLHCPRNLKVSLRGRLPRVIFHEVVFRKALHCLYCLVRPVHQHVDGASKLSSARLQATSALGTSTHRSEYQVISKNNLPWKLVRAADSTSKI